MYKKTATLAAVLLLASTTSGRAQDWRTITSMRQYKSEDALAVNVEYGAGKLVISPGESNLLYKTTLRYDANAFKPRSEYENGRLRVGIESGSIKGRHKSGRLDVALGTSVPLDLDLKFGAAQAEMELGGLKIRKAHIATGASETRITVSAPNREPCSVLKLEVGAADFSATGLGNLNCASFDIDGGVGDVTLDFNGAWRIDSDVKIDMGLGSLTLRVPRGLGVQVHKDGFLASFDSQGLIKRGDRFYSENWESAGNRVSFNIDAAFGAIRIQWVEPEAAFRRAER